MALVLQTWKVEGAVLTKQPQTLGSGHRDAGVNHLRSRRARSDAHAARRHRQKLFARTKTWGHASEQVRGDTRGAFIQQARRQCCYR